MRGNVALSLCIGTLLVPSLLPGTPAPVAGAAILADGSFAGATYLRAVGSGHVTLQLPSDAYIDASYLLRGGGWVSLFISGASHFFSDHYFHLEGEESWTPSFFPGHTLSAGTYQVYLAAPPGQEVLFQLNLPDLAGSAAFDLAPWDARVARLADMLQWLGVTDAHPPLVLPVEWERLTFDLPSRSVILINEQWRGAGAAAAHYSVYRVQDDPLTSRCTVGWFMYAGPGAGGLSALTMQVVDPGTWQVHVDHYAAGAEVLFSHNSYAMVAALDPADPLHDADSALAHELYHITGIQFDQGVVEAVEPAACAGVPQLGPIPALPIPPNPV